MTPTMFLPSIDAAPIVQDLPRQETSECKCSPVAAMRHSGPEQVMTRRAIIAIFDSQPQAYDAARAIQQLGEETVHVRQAAIVIKDAQGAVSVPDTTELGVSGVMLGGPIVGSMIGLLAGPVGVAAGILLGGLVGRVVDVANRERNQDFLDAAGELLEPGQAAIVAEVDEDATEPLDAAVARSGGRIKRRELSP
jgi:uncharacterized membrane protein